jgi:hypothetical protein
MFFNKTTHIIENGKDHAPGHNYSLVGSVPTCLLDARPADRRDILAGRAIKTAAGSYIAYHGRQWESVGDIVTAAAQYPEVRLCKSPTCACRSLFT